MGGKIVIDDIIKTLNNNNESQLDFTKDVSWILNNNTNTKLSKSINITIEEPINNNSRNYIVDDTIPFVKLNNTISTKNDLLLAENNDVFLQQSLAKMKSRQTFEQNLYINKRYNLTDIIYEDNLIITLNKTTGFNGAIKEAINRSGSFNIYDNSNNLIFTSNLIKNYLYNSDIKTFVLNNLNNTTSKRKLNISYIKNNNNIPIKVIDGEIIKTLPEYSLNSFMVDIKLINNNILKYIIQPANKSESLSTTYTDYVLTLGFLFDVVTNDKFPINFI